MDFADSSATAEYSDERADATVAYHEESDTYRAEFDSHDRPPGEAVIEAVATASECDPLDLPPLYDAVDTEALDLLFTSEGATTAGGMRAVTFEYADYLVTVNRHGTVEVDPASSTDE